MAGDSYSAEPQFSDGFVQLFRGHLGMLQGNGCKTCKALGIRLAPGGKLLVLNSDDPAGKVAVRFIPPGTLMRKNLNIDSELIERLDAFRVQEKPPIKTV